MRRLLAAALALALCSAAPVGHAQPTATATTVGANLNITPKRVTFDKARRSATVYVYNQGNAPATVDVALVDRIMLPDGEIVAAEDAAARPGAPAVAAQLKSAKPILQISPRRITLQPGQGQTVRVRIASAPENASGEFRSHLTVTTLPPPNTGVSAEAAGAADNTLTIQITSVYGISIPAIVRFNDPDVRAAIENVRVGSQMIGGKNTPTLTLDLVRQGASSLFGNIEVRARGRSGEPIGIVRGVGVYPEIGRRTVIIPLTRDPGADKLDITFTDDDTAPGKQLAKLAL
jgi:P pilus assembly chaperone PapD